MNYMSKFTMKENQLLSFLFDRFLWASFSLVQIKACVLDLTVFIQNMMTIVLCRESP